MNDPYATYRAEFEAEKALSSQYAVQRLSGDRRRWIEVCRCNDEHDARRLARAGYRHHGVLYRVVEIAPVMVSFFGEHNVSRELAAVPA